MIRKKVNHYSAAATAVIAEVIATKKGKNVPEFDKR